MALIGHSQGGIVAATLASDWAEEYTIEHVVTAGSPVANHPIPQRTWVTSVEIDDELVAALDGAANPVTDNWLTVQGHVSPAPAATPSTVHSDGSCTPGATPITGLTPYDAAPVWFDQRQGVVALDQIPSGRLSERHRPRLPRRATPRSPFPGSYQRRAQGNPLLPSRMTQSATIAPSERTTEFSTFGG